MARILVHRPKNMRCTVLREELLHFFNWNHCAAHIAHILERKTAARLDDMETAGQAEGLLWIQITEEHLYEEMLRAFSPKTIRETLKGMAQKGVVVSAKEGVGKVKHLLYNYTLVDDCVTANEIMERLPDADSSPVKLPVAPSVKFPPNFPGDDSVSLSVLNLQGHITNQDTAKPTSQDPAVDTTSTLEPDDDGKFGRVYNGRRPLRSRKQPKGYNPNSPSEVLRRMRENSAAGSQVDSEAPVRMSDGTPAAPGAPTVREALSFASRWNAGCPDRPVDPYLFSNCHAFREESFRSRFDEIIAKVQQLNQGGADIGFGRVIGKDRASGAYNFALILNGDWDWMAKPKTSKGKPDSSWIDQMRKDRDERRAART